jgi:hypothetical protein
MNPWITRLAPVAIALTLVVTGCSHHDEEVRNTDHYTSAAVHGQGQRINLDEVQKAFWETQGKDFNSWMQAFEKRVNEIYDGPDVVSIDAQRHEGHLAVTGYLDKKGQPGFQNGDEKLFTIEQTGQVANNDVPYRVSDYSGHPYYEGHHSLLDNPFLQFFLISSMMHGWGGHYYTPPQQVIILHDYRNTYRQSPEYQTQRQSNRSFYSRYKQKELGGGYKSNRSFNSGNFSGQTGTKRRSWLGGNNPNAGTMRDEQRPSWGGRRSNSGGSSSWGGRRSGGFSGGHSFGGRRR